MKQIRPNKRNKKKLSLKVKAIIASGVCVVLILGIFFVIKVINRFFDNHYFQFNQVVSIQLASPLEIKKREAVVQYIELLDYPDEIDTPLEEYICDKFGVYDCKTALAIAKAESGLREEAFNVNSNSSIDVGVFQINSTHFDRPGCSLKELVDAEKNVDCAFEIFSEQGWAPWTVYRSGAFKNHI